MIAIASETTAIAAPPSIDECISAHEQAQVLIKQSKLRDAKERLRVCQSESCPAVARKDCGTWSSDIERTEPTVIVVARDPAGHDLVNVKILVDGAVVAEKIDGKPMPLDPGAHALRLEAADGRSVAFDVVIISGDRNRPVVGVFENAKPAITPTLTTKPIEAPRPSEKPIERRDRNGASIPTISYVLGAVALGGLASFGTFALIGKDQESCVPNCQRSDVDDFRRSYLIADISLGVGLVAAAGAIWFALSKK